MKAVSLLVLTALITVMVPSGVQAEIYKWKDKNGTTRYSDVPPPSNIKNESIGKNTTKTPAVAPVENGSVPLNIKGGTAAPAAALSKDEAAAKRDQEVEAKKKAELKYRQESCAAAQTNLRMYSAGGRLMTTDENGERRYLGDDEIGKGKADAQQAVEKFCD
jgi:hypothetical protein